MKRLILIRHAKSSWKAGNVTDFYRPLNERGKRDAPFMGKLLKKMKVKPDLVISSPALRASETAKFISSQLDISNKDIKYDEDIYEASADELIEILRSVDKTLNTIVLVAHNPGLTSLSNYLSDKYIDNIPTTGVVSLTYKGEQWPDLNSNSCSFDFFEYPKKYFTTE